MRAFLCCGKARCVNENYFKTISDICDNTKPVLYLASAMKVDECETRLDEIKSQLEIYNFKDIKVIEDANELNKVDFNEYSFIYIAEGNIYKLLFELKISGAFDRLKQHILNNGIVYTESGSSVLFGRDIKSCSSLINNTVGLINTKGFDLLGGII